VTNESSNAFKLVVTFDNVNKSAVGMTVFFPDMLPMFFRYTFLKQFSESNPL